MVRQGQASDLEPDTKRETEMQQASDEGSEQLPDVALESGLGSEPEVATEGGLGLKSESEFGYVPESGTDRESHMGSEVCPANVAEILGTSPGLSRCWCCSSLRPLSS